MNIYYEDKDPQNDNKDPQKEDKPSNHTDSEQSNPDLPTPNNPNTRKRNILIIFFSIVVVSIIGYFSYAHYIDSSRALPLDSCIANTNVEIYDHYKNTIVMVKHRYGIQIRIEDNEPIILEDQYIEDFEIYASGFFIDDEGKIITNRHVVSSSNQFPDDIQAEIKNIKIKLVAGLPKNTPPQDYKDRIYQLLRGEQIINNDITIDDDNSLDSIITDIEPNIVAYFDNYDIQIEPVSLELHVMLHDSDEWLPAHVLKTTENEDVDVALIQLNSKKTPSSVTNYVTLEQAVIDDSSLKPGTKAIMIGFPMGMNLASTNNGIIKGQMYEGDINKESDGIKIQYSIPSTQGASGAPIFDSCGRLIAVNFSGYDQQGFNFGIVAKHILDLAGVTTVEEAIINTQ